MRRRIFYRIPDDEYHHNLCVIKGGAIAAYRLGRICWMKSPWIKLPEMKWKKYIRLKCKRVKFEPK